MKISECIYCGLMAIANQDVCASCQAFTSPETEPVAAPPEGNEFQPVPQSAAMPVYAAPNDQHVPPTFQNNRPFPPREPALDSNCLNCRTPLPRGQRMCFDCEHKKSSPFKYVAVLLIFGVLGFLSFDYVYEQVSPYGTLRKYAKTTGADDSLVYENFVLQGDTTVTVDAPPGFAPEGMTNSRQASESFLFKMIFKKPNISSIEMMNGEETVYKQVFDGTRGFKYTNMPGQPAGYQDSDDAFASKKMGLGMEEYDSLEFMNEAAGQEFGPQNIKVLTDKKEFEVADLKKPTGAKTILVGKQKRNGKTDASLLVFDQKTGLLLGIVKNDAIGNLRLTTIVHFDKYTKFPVKRKGLFGVAETRVLVPTKMSFVTHGNNSAQVGGTPVITIELDVKAVELDAPLDAGYFTR